MRIFLFNPRTSKEPTSFYVKLKRKKNIYVYSFSYNLTSITKEKLGIVINGKTETYFERENKDKQRIYQYRSNAKHFILEMANEKDLDKFTDYINQRRTELNND